jgi:hypothetical protein
MVEWDGGAGPSARMSRAHDTVEVTAAASLPTSLHMGLSCAAPPAHRTMPRYLTSFAPCCLSLLWALVTRVVDSLVKT